MRLSRVLILLAAVIAALAMAVPALALDWSATGAAAMSETFTPLDGRPVVVRQVTLHLSAAGGAGDLTITLDSAKGAAYDTVIYSKDMTTVTDISRDDLPAIYLNAGDKLVFAWANAGSKTWGLSVVYEWR